MLNLSTIIISIMILTNAQNIYVDTTYPDIATYIWSTKNIETMTHDYLYFASNNRVSDIYLQYSNSVTFDDYASFISAAHQKDIQVHLLDGAPTWATRDGKSELSNILTWLSLYQSAVAEDAQFDGIHLDIEFYLLDTDDRGEERAMAQYMKRISEAKIHCDEHDLTLSTSIPFWFDKFELPAEKNYDNLSQWNISQVDNTVIMAYRNTMYGSNAIMGLIKDELLYACKNPGSITIGLETVRSSEGHYLSFYDKPKTDLKYLLKALPFCTAFNKDVNGYAVHHLDAWMEHYSK